MPSMNKRYLPVVLVAIGCFSLGVIFHRFGICHGGSEGAVIEELGEQLRSCRLSESNSADGGTLSIDSTRGDSIVSLSSPLNSISPSSAEVTTLIRRIGELLDRLSSTGGPLMMPSSSVHQENKHSSNALSDTINSPKTTQQEAYYDEKYFAWQDGLGKFGGEAKQYWVRDYIKSSDLVLDFGSGGCHFVSRINAKVKIGIDINPIARAACRREYPEVVVPEYLSEIEDESVDVATSMSVLEHVEAPVAALREILPKLKKGGLFIGQVKNEGVMKPRAKYVKDNIDQHLYTWNPLLFGNMFAAAGYEVLSVEPTEYAWPPNFTTLLREKGLDEFTKEAKEYGKRTNSWMITLVARRPF